MTASPNLDLLGPGREDLKALFGKIFQKNPYERIDIYDLLDDPWVRDYQEKLVDLDLVASSSRNSSFDHKDISDTESFMAKRNH